MLHKREQETLLANIPGGIAIYRVKKNGIVKADYISESLAKMCGYTAEEFMDYLREDACINLVREDIPHVMSALAQALDRHTNINVMYRVYSRQKKEILIRLDANVVYEDLTEEDAAVLYAMHTEVSEEAQRAMAQQKEQFQEALEQAERANKAKTDFLSRVSHDMRTPLNGILGVTSLLQSYITDINARKDLKQLEQSGKYLLNLINDTLDVSRIESGKLALKPVVCDGREVFNNVLSLVNPAIKEKRQHLNIHTNDLPFSMLYLDVGRVEQIIVNILGNAIKFTPEGGTIDFSMENLEVKDGVILDRVTIQDNGIGMKPEFIPHLFEPFSQENNTSTSSSQGTGLGMTITKQIIERMGGEISVESEIGKGTRFTLLLPMPVATEQQIEDWKKLQFEEKNGHSLEGKRILLCEDHPLNATIAIRILDKRGILTDHAPNGQIGLEMFRKSEPGFYDAVLMDIRMPVMNGIDATRAIRSLAREDAGRVPIIAMTANALTEDVRETAEAGMNAHLSKPIDTVKLFHVLEQLVQPEDIYIRPRVLVVDDIEVNRIVVRESISGGFDVIEAANGKEALEILDKVKGIDAVITDIQMPVMDGAELIRRIRKKEQYRHIAIIANTQYGAPQQEEELLELGADDFIYKPTTPKIIQIRLHNVLKKA